MSDFDDDRSGGKLKEVKGYAPDANKKTRKPTMPFKCSLHIDVELKNLFCYVWLSKIKSCHSVFSHIFFVWHGRKCTTDVIDLTSKKQLVWSYFLCVHSLQKWYTFNGKANDEHVLNGIIMYYLDIFILFGEDYWVFWFSFFFLASWKISFFSYNSIHGHNEHSKFGCVCKWCLLHAYTKSNVNVCSLFVA